MDFISKAKDIGSSAFGSSSSSGASGSSSGSGSGGGLFSNFFNLSIQKMVLILAFIAFIISVGTVAILLWKSKSSQKWPPEIAKCPDRMALNADGTGCVDTYDLGLAGFAPDATNCGNFGRIKDSTFSKITGDGGYVPWEGILDGKASRASSLKCAI
jgi:preprotein translocase subunit SecG